ncbi:hypothetical protein GGG16DRAFT_129808 [Schizophyllum commune]
MGSLRGGRIEESVGTDGSGLEGGPAPTGQPDDGLGLLLATPDPVNHYRTILQLCDGLCGLCLARALAHGGRCPSPDMAHNWQKCPGLSTDDARQEFYAFRTSIKYSHGHALCWVCHIAATGPSQLHGNPLLEQHPNRRVQMKAEAFHDLVQSSTCRAARRHSWDTASKFAEWITDKDATEEPTSVMALMNFVRRKYT